MFFRVCLAVRVAAAGAGSWRVGVVVYLTYTPVFVVGGFLAGRSRKSARSRGSSAGW